MNIKRVCIVVAASAMVLSMCGNSFATLTGAWLLEEGSGTATVNTGSVGAAGDGTLLGTTGTPAWVPGLYNGSSYALQFNYNTGTSAYDPLLVQRVRIGGADPRSYDFVRNTPGATLMAWIKIDSGLNATRTIFSFDSEDVVGTPRARANIQIINNGQIRALGRKGGESGSSTYTTGTGTIVAGNTYFVVGVFDYANANILVYINGVLSKTIAEGGLGARSINASFTAGNSTDVPNTRSAAGSNTPELAELWFGTIDGMRVYNESLTAQQILDIYNAEVVPEPATIALAGMGLAGLVVFGRRRMRNAA